MKIKDIRGKEEKELQKMLAVERNVLRELRFKIAAKQLKKIQDYGKTKKNIARVLTVMRERELIREAENKE